MTSKKSNKEELTVTRVKSVTFQHFYFWLIYSLF